MFSTPAFAQGVGAASTSAQIFQGLLPIIPIMIIFYFLLIRPQNARVKAHRAMIESLKRGDTVVTSGGLIGKIAKLTDGDVSVELAPNVVVKVVRQTITEVRNKDVAPANDTAKG